MLVCAPSFPVNSNKMIIMTSDPLLLAIMEESTNMELLLHLHQTDILPMTLAFKMLLG